MGRGNPGADVVLVGEAPGEHEATCGIPFVGSAGKTLDRVLRLIGIDPVRDVWITNLVRHRPPENRKPKPKEVDSCIKILEEEIKIIRPKHLVALGGTAASALAGTTISITAFAGKSFPISEFPRLTGWGVRGTVFFQFHPAALLYDPALEKKFVENWLKFRKTYQLWEAGK